MQVLVLGATGNVGLRAIPALLTHKHSVVAFVRSPSKLQSSLPNDVYKQIKVVEGQVTDSAAVKKAILDHNCDAVVSAAGLAAVAPWNHSDFPTIFRSVLAGVQEAGAQRGKPLRTWFMGGMGVLYNPGTTKMLSDSMPIYLEHRQNIALLRSLPPNAVEWSMLCPADMKPESEDFSVPTKSTRGRLTAQVDSPPKWNETWVKSIPLVGRTMTMGMNISRYETTLEQNVDLIASDLARSEKSPYVGHTVGIIDESR